MLQDVNYTHPDTTSTVAGIVTALSSLSRFIQPPFSSWVADFDNWAAPATRNYIISKLAAGTIDCPVPLTSDNATYAARVMQFLADIPINSTCCQQNGYCGAQYSTDVKFLWGLPKPSSSPLASAASVVTSVSAAAGGAIDDGGCDLLAGYIPQQLLEGALKAAHGPNYHLMSSVTEGSAGGLTTGLHALRHLPSPHQARLALALSARSQQQQLSAAQRALLFKNAAVDSVAAMSALAAALAVDSDVTLIPCHVMTTRLRVQLTPLRNQSDFIASMEHSQAAASAIADLLPPVDLSVFGIDQPGSLSPGTPGPFSDNQHTQWLPPAADSGRAFFYSLTFVYYDQYRTIRGTAVTLIAVAVGAVYGAGLLVTHPAVATTTALLVLSVTVQLMGFVWMLNPSAPDPYGAGPWGVDINAVSVVNAAMATGLSVEFCVHVAGAFTAAVGSRKERVSTALASMGSSVFTGITLTKLVGVLVLAWAPSALFRLYYFRMYLGLIVLGAFHGLAVLPVALSLVGWQSDAVKRA